MKRTTIFVSKFFAMSTFRFLFSLTLLAYLLFQVSTCSNQECKGGQACSTAVVRQKSSSLNHINVQVMAVVNSTFSVPGLKVYSILDDSGEILLVNASPFDGSLPEVGDAIVICAVVHELINVNGEVKFVVLEELLREPIPASLSLQ